MDIKWKDGNGNILNVNESRLIYLDVITNVKTIIKREEVKKITIEDGLINIFTDFENDLALTIVIPKRNERNAVKIFNEYDKTGKMLKRKSGNFFIYLILESSVITYNPFTGILFILGIVIISLGLIIKLPIFILGEDLGLLISRVLVIGLIVYTITSYILLKIKRRKLKED